MQTLFIMLFLLSSVFLVISAVALIVVYLKKIPCVGEMEKEIFRIFGRNTRYVNHWRLFV